MTCAQKLAEVATQAAATALLHATEDAIEAKHITSFAIALLPYIKPFGCPPEEPFGCPPEEK